MSQALTDASGELAAGTLAARRASNQIIAALDRLSDVVSFLSLVCGIICAASIMAMALITAYDVLMRYALNSPTTWATESSGYLLIVCAMFGAVYTAREGGHIAFELIYDRLRRRTRILLAAITSILAVLYLAVLTWNGLDMTITAFQQGGGHIGDMNMPQWATYQIIPIGGALFCLELLRQFYVNARELQSSRSANKTAVREL